MLSLGVIAAVALATPELPQAELPGVELRWSAPPGCPSREQVEAWLGELVPTSALVRPVRAEITVEAVGDGYASRLILDAGPASRTRGLEAAECGLLARANVVVVAVGLDPLAVAEATLESRDDASPPRELEPEPEREVGPLRPGPVPRESQSRPDRLERVPDEPERRLPAAGDAAVVPPRRLEFGARIGGGAGGLLLPGAGLGVMLAPWVGTARIQVRAVGQLWPGRRVAFEPDRDVAGIVRLASGGLRLCPVLGKAAVRFPLCVGADAGAVLGRGTGNALTTTLTAAAPWAAAAAQLGLELAVARRVSMWIALEGLVSLYRPSFSVEGASEVWTMGAGGLRGLVGVQIHRAREIP